jgi:penicillin-binding protein 1C
MNEERPASVICQVFLLLLVILSARNSNGKDLLSYDEVRRSYVKSDSLLLDRNGENLHELRIDKGRRRLDWASLDHISPVFLRAVIQAEDQRFYHHSGVDYRSIAGAVVRGLTQESLRGASTITMQVASALDVELRATKGRRSIWQKGVQILRARQIEKQWSKAQILEVYVNLVTFRGELQGIGAASRGLFGKEPHGLDQSESVILASLIRSPNATSSEVLKRATALSRTLNWRPADDQLGARIKQVFLGANFSGPRAGDAPHVARQLLKGRPAGTATVCTLDARTQRFGHDRLAHHLIPMKSQNAGDGTLLVVENRTGDVLAYVSHSSEPRSERFVDGIQAKRQAGSTLKPFLYALAFDMRVLTPASLLEDSPLDVAVFQGIYQPGNYDHQFRGPVTARTALASSINIPAVRTLMLIGTEPFLNKLRQLGIKGLNESGDFYGPSIALGTADVSLWELVRAYRTLANDGIWNELSLGRGHPSAQQKRAYSSEAAFLVSDILSDRAARSLTFSLENPLSTRFWTAVKTGTSKDMRDNWCIGFSKKYTVGVWVGNFSGEPMWNVSGMSGAAPIWIEMMNFLHQDEPGEKPILPEKIRKRDVEFSQNAEAPRAEWFIRGTEPDSGNHRAGQFNHKIEYPPSGAVIAVDPDIPSELQKVFFVAQTNERSLRWVLNNITIGLTDKPLSWKPKQGNHALSLVDEAEEIVDSVRFEVKGPVKESIPLEESD